MASKLQPSTLPHSGCVLADLLWFIQHLACMQVPVGIAATDYQNLWVLKATAPRAQLFELNILLLVPPGYSKQSAKQALETACKRIKPVRYMLRYGYSTVLEYRPLKEGTPKCVSSILLTNKPSEGLMSRSNELWAGCVCLLDFVL